MENDGQTAVAHVRASCTSCGELYVSSRVRHVAHLGHAREKAKRIAVQHLNAVAQALGERDHRVRVEELTFGEYETSTLLHVFVLAEDGEATDTLQGKGGRDA